jgi:arylsulfatase A-like enzyme
MTPAPNVVVFLTDQQRWDTTGLHGNPLGLTPNFDRLASRGTHLYNAFTCQPVCAPARAVLQTGMYASNTGVYRNGLALSSQRLTLAQCFKSAGYQTAYIGKWHLGSDESAGPVAAAYRAGYQRWLASNLLEFTSTPYKTVLYNEEDEPVTFPGYRVDALTDAAIRYLNEPRRAPFFLFLSFLEPHHQNHVDDFVPPDGYRAAYAGRWVPPDLAALGGSTHQHLGGYFGMVKRLDEAMGRLVDALKSLGLFEDTILLFTSDHGCHFKTRNGEYKRSCHEASVRVPAMLTGPGFDGGGQVRQLVSLVDLPPTLLDAAGLPVPEQMQGLSLVPLLRRQALDWPEEVFIQISESQVGRAVRTRRWKYSVSAPDKSGWETPGADHYVEEFLYDLEADPHELTNLIGLASHQEVSRILRERLVRRMLAAGESEPTIEAAPVRPSGQRRVSESDGRA